MAIGLPNYTLGNLSSLLKSFIFIANIYLFEKLVIYSSSASIEMGEIGLSIVI